MTRSTSRMAAGALAGLMLSSCGGGSDKSAKPTTVSPTDATSASTSTTVFSSSSTTSGSTAAPGTYTKPGTKLKLGEKAIVPWTSSGVVGPVGVTASTIKKGDPADLAPLKLGDQVAGQTPYYITFVVTNEAGSDLASSSLGKAGGLLADGSQASKVSTLSTFSPCAGTSAPKTFTTKGATYTTCVVALAGGSSMVTGVEYDQTFRDDPATDYASKPITWK